MMTGSDEKHIKDLLAIIHGDGGHHTHDVGYSESITDAAVVITKLRTDLDKAQFDLRAMQHRWSGHDCYPRNGND